MKEVFLRIKHIFWLMFIPGDYVFMTKFKMKNFVIIYNIVAPKQDGDIVEVEYRMYKSELPTVFIAKVIKEIGIKMEKDLKSESYDTTIIK